jgi:hypothetical protein
MQRAIRYICRNILEGDSYLVKLGCEKFKFIQHKVNDCGLFAVECKDTNEFARETTGMHSVPLDAFPRNKDWEAASEHSFRRGYCHGYSQGIDDSLKKKYDMLCKFFDDKLTPWRFSDCSKLIVPPEIWKSK